MREKTISAAKENLSERSLPKDLVRMMGAEVEVDVAKRILQRAVIVTRMIASDGGIVAPGGILAKFYEQNPVVCAKHNISYDEARSLVIGRSLGLRPIDIGMESTTQFADTELGREYAYLYGVNDKKEVYARGWSFSWTTLEHETWTVDQAKAWVGAAWDDDLVPPWVRDLGTVWVATKSLMHEYSAVELGADKLSLSRAYKDKGIRVAGEMLTAIDLNEARAELAQIRTEHKEIKAEVQELRGSILALSGDGEAAAARGDTAELLASVRELRDRVAERELARGLLAIARTMRRE